jgi:hypothetical protein
VKPIALYDVDRNAVDISSSTDMMFEGVCHQMEHCAVVKQRHVITFEITDNTFPVRGEVDMRYGHLATQSLG